MESISIMALLIIYGVGTLIGLWFGYKGGVRHGADITLVMLAENNYIRTKLINGETQILPLDAEE